jgi:PAS domain S-box-containing protein
VRRSEEKYRGLVETLPLMVLQFDRDCRLLYVNPAARTLTGYGDEDLTAPEGWQRLIVPEDWPAVQELHHKSLAGQRPSGEFRLRARDGSEKVGYALAQPQDRDGTCAGSTFLIVDRTQQRQLEDDLQRVQRLELVGRLAGGVVHDLNNLLTVILSAVDNARHKLPPDTEVVEDLQYLGQAAEQATQLTGQLLTFSKQRRFPARQVDVTPVVRRTLELLRPGLPGSVVVEADLKEGVCVLADESQLHQVVLNLCLNARDAMPRGGHLIVCSSLERDGEGGQTWGRLVVEDTGVGMDERVLARIFDPFFSTKEHGHGLGLAVVQQIVHGFGGRILVRSHPGQGTRFEVWLPTA